MKAEMPPAAAALDSVGACTLEKTPCVSAKYTSACRNTCNPDEQQHREQHRRSVPDAVCLLQASSLSQAELTNDDKVPSFMAKTLMQQNNTSLSGTDSPGTQ